MKKFLIKTEGGSEIEMVVDKYQEIDIDINDQSFTIIIKENGNIHKPTG